MSVEIGTCWFTPGCDSCIAFETLRKPARGKRRLEESSRNGVIEEYTLGSHMTAQSKDTTKGVPFALASP